MKNDSININTTITISPRKVSGERRSSIIATNEELDEAAIDAFRIIRDSGRRELNLSDFISILEETGKTDCQREDVDMYLDTNLNSLKVGFLKKTEFDKVIETKIHCAECPIRRGCLAISLTSPQLTESSKTERLIPGTKESGRPLTMSEYLIFGGYTPPERREIHNSVCDLLELSDSIQAITMGEAQENEYAVVSNILSGWFEGRWGDFNDVYSECSTSFTNIIEKIIQSSLSDRLLGVTIENLPFTAPEVSSLISQFYLEKATLNPAVIDNE